MLCPSRTRPFHGEATPDADSSDLSASLVSLPVIHEFSPGRCRSEDVLDSHTPRPAQIGVCPQPDQTPDHGPPMRQEVDVGHTQDRATPVPVVVIPPHPLDAGNAFRRREEDPPHSSWARGSEPPAPSHNTNATAELSPWNGNPASPVQPNARPVRDDPEWTWPATTLCVPCSPDLRPPFTPLERAYDELDPSLICISDDVVLFWHPHSAFSQWTPSPFTVDFVVYNCAEQFMMASKACLFGDDTALSAILASNDP